MGIVTKNKIQIVTLEQLPILEERVDEAYKIINKRFDDLDLSNLVVTEESKKEVKKLRADLNNEFKEYENNRKALEKAYNAPLDAFKTKYNKIAQLFKNGDAILKKEVYRIDYELKYKKTELLKIYYKELCESKNIDFIKFEDLGLNVTLSISESNLKKQILSVIEGVEKDIELINSYPENKDFKTDVIIEYKVHRDLNRSVKVVQDRNAQKLKLKESENKIETKIEPIETAKPLKTEVLQAPKIEEEQEIFEVNFSVRGTLDQLKALKSFLVNNNIQIIK